MHLFSKFDWFPADASWLIALLTAIRFLHSPPSFAYILEVPVLEVCFGTLRSVVSQNCASLRTPSRWKPPTPPSCNAPLGFVIQNFYGTEDRFLSSRNPTLPLGKTAPLNLVFRGFPQANCNRINPFKKRATPRRTKPSLICDAGCFL